MNDLISRQAAIDAVTRAIWHYPNECYKNLNVYEVTEALVSDAINSLPSAEPKIDDENELKFYYVESIDDYWIGQRLDNFYYADWHDGLRFVWSHSRYLPWGEHIVDENTLWKEHTYPSEPIEVPFTEWIVGFVQKYFVEPKAVDVVRCENCKHCKIVDWVTSNHEKYVTMYHCKLYDNVLKNNDDYCNYGERKEDDD